MELNQGDQKVERPERVAVVDASVAAKWFVEEEFTDQALKMVEDYERRRVDLRSVELMPFEVMNALRYNPEMGRAEIERAGDALSRFKIAQYPLLGDLKTLCLEAAYRYGLTVYDASYLSLSRFLDTELYTADKRFIEKTRGEKKVRHIREYGKRG
jgi:predicted nucleic acid-binding protein